MKFQERRIREESQKSAIRFERATSLLAVAKQQVALSQDSLNREKTVSAECLEVSFNPLSLLYSKLPAGS